MIIIIIVIHTNVVKTMFSTFACEEIEDGEFWLQDDLSIRCWDSEH